jgi:phenylalanyl-tRNA synthetase beta chain
MAKQFNDIVIKRSPDIIAKRLKMVGIRPINNIVDLTNYILIEIGQPMHAFDRNIINNIVVRNATDNEKIVTLDEKEHILDKSMLVIADEKKPLAVAGIMGGSQSGINDKTNSIVLESAKFARDNIRRTSRKINLHSDSSARFEKGIDYYSQTLAINRAINLITKYQWGKVCEGVVEVIDKPANKKTINFTVADIKRILGIEIPVKEIIRILNNLSIKTTVKDNILTSDIPEYRDDLININDLSEEIIRIYSYDNIKSTLMDGAKQTQGGYNEKDKFMNKIKESLVYNGLSEILTYSFTTPKYLELLNIKDEINPIKLMNPLGEDLSVMRTTLIHSMILTLYSNIVKGNKVYLNTLIYNLQQIKK